MRLVWMLLLCGACGSGAPPSGPLAPTSTPRVLAVMPGKLAELKTEMLGPMTVVTVAGTDVLLIPGDGTTSRIVAIRRTRMDERAPSFSKLMLPRMLARPCGPYAAEDHGLAIVVSPSDYVEFSAQASGDPTSALLAMRAILEDPAPGPRGLLDRVILGGISSRHDDIGEVVAGALGHPSEYVWVIETAHPQEDVLDSVRWALAFEAPAEPSETPRHYRFPPATSVHLLDSSIGSHVLSSRRGGAVLGPTTGVLTRTAHHLVEQEVRRVAKAEGLTSIEVESYTGADDSRVEVDVGVSVNEGQRHARAFKVGLLAMEEHGASEADFEAAVLAALPPSWEEDAFGAARQALQDGGVLRLDDDASREVIYPYPSFDLAYPDHMDWVLPGDGVRLSKDGVRVEER